MSVTRGRMPSMMTDLQLLHFEEDHPGSGPAKDRAIYGAGAKPLEYYVRLRHLRRLPSSHESHPMLMHRLERLDATSWRTALGRRTA